MVALAVAVASCSGSKSAPVAKSVSSSNAASAKPIRIVPTAAGARALAGPASDGDLWVLAQQGSVSSLHLLDVAHARQLEVAPVAAGSDAVALSSTGVLAVGIGTSTAGAVELCNGGTGTSCRTVPIGAPVRSVAFGASGTTLYVLDGNSKSASVTLVQVGSGKVASSVGVALDAVDAVPSPSERSLYVLQPTGLVDVVQSASGKETAVFRVGTAADAEVLAPSGGILYVLKGAGAVRNVAVVQTATESVRRVLPAPADTVALGLNPSGTELFDLTGTSAAGNVQVFRLASSGS